MMMMVTMMVTMMVMMMVSLMVIWPLRFCAEPCLLCVCCCCHGHENTVIPSCFTVVDEWQVSHYPPKTFLFVVNVGNPQNPMTSMGSVIAENRQLKGPHNALAHGNFKERDRIPPPNQGQKQSRFGEKGIRWPQNREPFHEICMTKKEKGELSTEMVSAAKIDDHRGEKCKQVCAIPLKNKCKSTRPCSALHSNQSQWSLARCNEVYSLLLSEMPRTSSWHFMTKDSCNPWVSSSASRLSYVNTLPYGSQAVPQIGRSIQIGKEYQIIGFCLLFVWNSSGNNLTRSHWHRYLMYVAFSNSSCRGEDCSQGEQLRCVCQNPKTVTPPKNVIRNSNLHSETPPSL